MKEVAGAYPVTVGEGFIYKQNDEHRQNSESILDKNKYLWPMVEVIPHHRIEFFGALGEQDQCEYRIQYTQAQHNHHANKKGWFVSIKNCDAISVLGATHGFAYPFKKQLFRELLLTTILTGTPFESSVICHLTSYI